MPSLSDHIKECLKGIDADESQSKDGWWETSKGAEFGREKLASILKLAEIHEKGQCAHRITGPINEALGKHRYFCVDCGTYFAAEQDDIPEELKHQSDPEYLESTLAEMVDLPSTYTAQQFREFAAYRLQCYRARVRGCDHSGHVSNPNVMWGPDMEPCSVCGIKLPG